jgi:hypothetical protein
MANRLFGSQFKYSFVRKPVELWCQVAIGATGAPTLSATKSKGITSVVRNSAGRYTITLNDKYQELYGAYPMFVLAAGAYGTSAASDMVVRSAAVTAATPTVVVEFLDGTGAANELANGVTLYLKLELNDSTVV